jgi:hypothetical protein
VREEQARERGEPVEVARRGRAHGHEVA